MALNFSDSKKIPITDYLYKLGIEPTRICGNDYWYKSPFRSETDPSFKVNTKLNLWYDHGSGEGGTILDLGAKIHACSVLDFHLQLEREDLHSNGFLVTRTAAAAPENKLVITAVNHLEDLSLIQYLNQRRISVENACQHCLEADFRIGVKSYKAIAFQNQSGGFELRNTWFKGCSSPKDVSYYHSDSSTISVFEGFIDFLSFRELQEDAFPKLGSSNFLVLNSVSLLARNIPTLKQYEEVCLFLDNDSAGRKAKADLKSAGISFNDHSEFYKSHKDLNDYLVGSDFSKIRRTGLRP